MIRLLLPPPGLQGSTPLPRPTPSPHPSSPREPQGPLVIRGRGRRRRSRNRGKPWERRPAGWWRGSRFGPWSSRRRTVLFEGAELLTPLPPSRGFLLAIPPAGPLFPQWPLSPLQPALCLASDGFFPPPEKPPPPPFPPAVSFPLDPRQKRDRNPSPPCKRSLHSMQRKEAPEGKRRGRQQEAFRDGSESEGLYRESSDDDGEGAPVSAWGMRDGTASRMQGCVEGG